MSTDGRVIIHAQLTQSERSGIRKNYIPYMRPNLKNVLIFLYQLSVKTNTAYVITFPLPVPPMYARHARFSSMDQEKNFLQHKQNSKRCRNLVLFVALPRLGHLLFTLFRNQNAIYIHLGIYRQLNKVTNNDSYPVPSI